MSVRATLDKRKRVLVPVFLVVALGAAGYSVWSYSKSGISTHPIDQVYFSDDDGKTYFEDAASKSFPFDHGGKPAYRAYVYRCGDDGKPFVGVIGRQVEVKAAVVNANYKSDGHPSVVEIAKPGTTKWISLASPDGMKLIQSLCPDGRPQSVLPGE